MSEFVQFKSEGVWQYFLHDKQGQAAQCNLRNAKLKTVGGSTKGLHEHLCTMHQISVLKQSASQPTTSKRHTTQSGSTCISKNEAMQTASNRQNSHHCVPAITNGAIERFHATMHSLITKWVGQNHQDWDAKLPTVTFAYRTSVHESMGF